METPSREHEALLTPAEVAALFRVDPKTVTRWARAGKLSAIRTLGGHRRFRESEVLALMGVPGPRTASRDAGTRTGSQGSGPRRAPGA